MWKFTANAVWVRGARKPEKTSSFLVPPVNVEHFFLAMAKHVADLLLPPLVPIEFRQLAVSHGTALHRVLCVGIYSRGGPDKGCGKAENYIIELAPPVDVSHFSRRWPKRRGINFPLYSSFTFPILEASIPWPWAGGRSSFNPVAPQDSQKTPGRPLETTGRPQTLQMKAP